MPSSLQKVDRRYFGNSAFIFENIDGFSFDFTKIEEFVVNIEEFTFFGEYFERRYLFSNLFNYVSNLKALLHMSK